MQDGDSFSHRTAATSVGSSPPFGCAGAAMSSSGSTPAAYRLPVRSAIVAVVRRIIAPSERGKVELPAERPSVGCPNERVCRRPRKAMVTASPAPAVPGPVRTATRTASRPLRVSGGATPSVSPAVQGGLGPEGSPNVPSRSCPRSGFRAASTGHMLPPVFPRRSRMNPQRAAGAVEFRLAWTLLAYARTFESPPRNPDTLM